MKAQPIPTPWRLVVEGDEENGEMITRTFLGPVQNMPRNLNEICFFTTGSFSDDVEAANAEFADKAINHHQELVTRLYNLKNQVELWCGSIEIIPMGDERIPAGMRLALVDADETLKKVIQ